jgi:hypothetical protein
MIRRQTLRFHTPDRIRRKQGAVNQSHEQQAVNAQERKRDGTNTDQIPDKQGQIIAVA